MPRVMRNAALFVAACLVLAFLATCGKESPTQPKPPDPPQPPPPAPVATRIAITPSPLAFNSLATTQKLTAVVYDQNGGIMSGAPVNWTSSDASVATVSGLGVVNAIGNGTARITARSGSASASVEVRVAQVAASIRLSPERLTLGVLGRTATFRATVLDAGRQAMPDAQVIWTSSDESVATVNAEGVVTAVGNGTATITATLGGVTATGLAHVMQRAVSIEIAPSTVRLTAVDQTVQLVAMARDQHDALIMNPPVEWFSSNGSVASVSEEGVVTAHRTGHATITATLYSLMATSEIEVALPAHRVTVVPMSVRFEAIGETRELSAEVFDVNGDLLMDAPLSWSSEDPSIATVDPAGTLTSVSAGSTQIVAQSGNVSGFVQVSVNLDRQALIALYRTTGGPNWNRNDNWLSDSPVDLWFGVATGLNGNVESLSLGKNNLSGSIPDELFDLKGLKVLRFFGNNLEGEISPRFEELVSLELLQLSINDLSGPIPSALGNLENLTVLQLYRNRLNGVLPPELGRLTRLGTLSVDANDLEGSIPPEFGGMKNLRVLTANSTNLSGPLPQELSVLENLEVLWLQDTGLCSPVNDEFTAWLNRLQDARVPLCENPDKGVLTALYHATDGPNWTDSSGWLSEDPLHEWRGVVTDSYGRVVTLDLTDNGLKGEIPPVLGKLEFLEVLFLNENDLEGEIPPELGDLRNLDTMVLSDNDLSGSVPPDLVRLFHLRFLILNQNRLSGTIPPELQDLGQLLFLHLQHNLLTGELPPVLGEFQALTELRLDNNLMTGGIPSELRKLTNLKVLSLGNNMFTGELPDGLGDLANLTELILYGNEGLIGALPNALTNLNLTIFLAGRTGLCLPADVDYQAWIAGFQHVRISRCSGTVDMGLTAYLTQATQSFDYPVPLVADEPALLRVFITVDEGEVSVPPVRAVFYNGGTVVHTVDIPGRDGPVPTRIDESALIHSSNEVIPGSILMPGLEMAVEIDPDMTLDIPDGIREGLPDHGRIEIDVKAMPPMDLVLVPFLWEEAPDFSFVSRIEALTADDGLFGQTRDLLPVGEFNLNVHAPVWTSVDPVGTDRNSPESGNVVSQLFRELELIRTLESFGQEYYMGMLRGYGGGGSVAHYTSLSSLHEGVIAHELGHNLSLLHSGCTLLSPDPYYPYENGAIGSWGFDIRTGTLLDPVTTDLMSYCGSEWIGEYSFSKALYYRLWNTTRLAANYSGSVPGLLVWGGASEDGSLILEPAFPVIAPPSLPNSYGSYRLTGDDDAGNVLFDFRFPMIRVADAGGSAFSFVVPIELDWTSGLIRISLSGPEGVVEITRNGGPSATLLLDSHTGSVRGILRESTTLGPYSAAARRLPPEPGLEAITSHGIP